MSYKKTSTSRTPEQQQAAEATAKRQPGRNPAPDEDKMGVQPDEVRERLQNELQKSTAEGP